MVMLFMCNFHECEEFSKIAYIQCISVHNLRLGFNLGWLSFLNKMAEFQKILVKVELKEWGDCAVDILSEWLKERLLQYSLSLFCF